MHVHPNSRAPAARDNGPLPISRNMCARFGGSNNVPLVVMSVRCCRSVSTTAAPSLYVDRNGMRSFDCLRSIFRLKDDDRSNSIAINVNTRESRCDTSADKTCFVGSRGRGEVFDGFRWCAVRITCIFCTYF